MKLLIAGDFVPVGRFERCLYDDSFDYNHIKCLTKAVDYSLLNFEAPIADDNAKRICKNGPNLKVSPASVEAIKQMGFDAVTLANNHFRDYGQEGIEKTICCLEKAGVEYVGGGIDYNEAQKILYKNFDDGKVAFVNFCENEYSIATKFRGGSMPLDITTNYHQIIEAKQKADFVVVVVHGGHEGYQLPSPRMKKFYHLLIDIGADVVANHHQHCFSGYEIYKEKPIFYGLGNFLFDWDGKRNSNWNKGYMISFFLNSTKIKFELLPYEQCNDKPGVFLLKDKDITEFWEKIIYLNDIIQDDDQLEKEFNAFVKQKAKGAIATLGPFANRYLMALVSRGLLPSFISKKKAAMMYNYINCEAHRDITLGALSNVLECD